MGDLEFKPVTDKEWDDMQELFGSKGAYGGCWCTYWRMKTSEFMSRTPSERKQSMKDTIVSGKVPGILAYKDGEPIGWCSLDRREAFVRLENSRILKRVDDKPAWSIVCFYIRKSERRMGVMRRLISEAVRYASCRGAEIVEGYPIDPGEELYPDPYAYTGLMSAFLDAGFIEVERRSAKRPIMRYSIAGKDPGKRGDQIEP